MVGTMERWISTWAQAHTCIASVTPSYRGRTMWLSVYNRLQGAKLRLRLSNREGTAPMHIGKSAVWTSASERMRVFFNDEPSAIVPPGEELCSDGVEMTLQGGEMVTVAVAFRGAVTSGNNIMETVLCGRGECVNAPQMRTVGRSVMDSVYGNLPAIPAIAAVEVLTDELPRLIVCFGDSITQQSRWTQPLARMMDDCAERKTIIINKGIGGNRLLSGPPSPDLSAYGRAGRSRFLRDVLEEAAVSDVIFAMGTNDIGWLRTQADAETCGAAAIGDCLAELAQAAGERGIRTYAATLTPRMGSLDYGPFQERERQKLNDWIRHTGAFDTIVDFDLAVRDKANPAILSPCCDSGDHLHPSPAGGSIMAQLAKEVLTSDVSDGENK